MCGSMRCLSNRCDFTSAVNPRWCSRCTNCCSTTGSRSWFAIRLRGRAGPRFPFRPRPCSRWAFAKRKRCCRSLIGYRILQEYFAFTEKFFFVELSGLEQLAASGFGRSAEILFLISPFERSDRHQILEMGVSPHTFRLNCAPVVNLFPQTAEPIRLDETRSEYPVIPDARRRRGMEVFSVDEVLSSNAISDEITYFEPFYSLRHSVQGNPERAFWKAVRRPSDFDDNYELMISFLNLKGDLVRP